MRNHFSPTHLLFFIFLLAFLLALIQIGILSFAFEKLGLPPALGFMVLLFSLFGSTINLPIARIRSNAPPNQIILPTFWGVLRIPVQKFHNETQISVNLGGCLIPVVLSIYLFLKSSLTLPPTLLGITTLTILSYYFSRPIPGLGIGMPIFIAPFSAALVGLVFGPEQSASLAYISGTLGVLIGADLLHLKEIPKLGAPKASIGGAGTFDGIFITGIVAAILA
ncbi:Uncharacterized membrane protein [Nitrosomonas cryotolerans]|uniref:Uncharacterized membrane protein n=1 Tax=Nitrosomonas cryotolerans ATCC 49181 TaxID=1131553 RepID=A0A1N6J3V9_9PROT|nr:DUF1614 domain-containing protein [Nitrosomonas cryotolerans]SFQ09719.1 Uncharacterized membrane protein [Nitrosomonas cryotolerans]SIO38957.1 Uncharacterized membrane protein [Nitrosomonas cryotolerans ATCC 49181]